MLIVDSSAVVELLTSVAPNASLLARLSEDGDLHAPHLIDVEVLSALRGLVRSGQCSPDRASDARSDFADLSITRYPHESLADRAWELRDNVTPYDAMFLALAELTQRPLVTCDRRLARSAETSATIELFGAGHDSSGSAGKRPR